MHSVPHLHRQPEIAWTIDLGTRKNYCAELKCCRSNVVALAMAYRNLKVASSTHTVYYRHSVFTTRRGPITAQYSETLFRLMYARASVLAPHLNA